MGMVGTHNTHVQHVREGDIGGECAAARHQRTVLETGHGAADETHIAPCSAIVLHSSCPAHGSGSSYSPCVLSSAPAARSAAWMRCGVAGNSSIKTPNGASASLIALTTAAGAPIAPPSPNPLALVTEACVGVAR